MLEVIKKLDSATIRGLIAVTIPIVVLIASFFGVDEAIFSAKLGAIGEKLVALFALFATAYTFYARLFKPTPPLTETAKQKTVEMVAAGKLQPVSAPAQPETAKQGGFVRAAMLGVILALGSIVVIGAGLSGCANTRAALANADTPSDYALVFLEGYDAALRTANQLKASGALAGDNLAKVQAAELKAWPLVQKIDPLRVAYEQTKSAADALALQLAIDNAIREAAEFIRLVRELRGS